MMMFRPSSGKRGFHPYRGAEVLPSLQNCLYDAFPLSTEERKSAFELFYGSCADPSLFRSDEIWGRLNKISGSIPLGFFYLLICGKLDLAFHRDEWYERVRVLQGPLDKTLSAIGATSGAEKLQNYTISEEAILTKAIDESKRRKWRGVFVPVDEPLFHPEKHFEPLVHILQHFPFFTMFSVSQKTALVSKLVMFDSVYLSGLDRRRETPLRALALLAPELLKLLKSDKFRRLPTLYEEFIVLPEPQEFADVQGVISKADRRSILLEAISMGRHYGAIALAAMRDSRDGPLFSAIASGSNRRVVLSLHTLRFKGQKHWDAACKPTDWTALPKELLSIVFGFLDAGSALRLKMVCKKWGTTSEKASGIFDNWMSNSLKTSFTRKDYVSWLMANEGGEAQQQLKLIPQLQPLSRRLHWPKNLGVVCEAVFMDKPYKLSSLSSK